MADLSDEGSFQILGRVPHSVLKGCSLLAEELVNSSKKQETLIDRDSRVYRGEKTFSFEGRTIEELYQFLKVFFSSSRVKQGTFKRVSL